MHMRHRANAVWEHLRGGLTFAELAAEMRPVYLIDLTLAPLGLLVAIAAAERPWAVVLIAPLFGVLRWFSKERRARLEQLIELNDAYRGTALLLGDVVEADDTYTGEHCKDVVRLALDVARELGLDVEQQRTVEFGALLHDIGKIAVPKEIVNKPGKLDPDEWAIIKTHTVEGQRMLERVGGFMGRVGRIVRCHHERWDGGGYPDGLRGAESHRGPDHLLLRRVQRDDDRPAVPQGATVRRRARGADRARRLAVRPADRRCPDARHGALLRHAPSRGGRPTWIKLVLTIKISYSIHTIGNCRRKRPIRQVI